MTYTPTHDEVGALLDWFARYDSHARDNDIEAMADMALFPLMVMTDDSAGECVGQVWDRATFVAAMSMAGAGSATVDFDNRRSPVFLDADLAVVTTDSTMTIDGEISRTRYVDVMAKEHGEWRFKSMIQPGWGDMLRQHLGA
ncbi:MULTISPECIES: nuclear transport factor 2 family protein [Catenuloplanes]|uniref:DUF4440 domain-containing protein n=1 Tax=Catenuloplanes niger TaxID=587534 RepID=A0AAE4CQW7_9ACTN|nr:nuclear transport factor 2 family protein [Catenuloplanes niger]MDR7321415.1 hypothetical protein [Catenuloplanes niger]